MMVERKLDGAVDESSADQEICKSNAIILCITCGKSGSLHLAELGLTVVWLAGWLTKFGQGLKF